jgi:hypothetical protein
MTWLVFRGAFAHRQAFFGRRFSGGLPADVIIEILARQRRSENDGAKIAAGARLWKWCLWG